MRPLTYPEAHMNSSQPQTLTRDGEGVVDSVLAKLRATRRQYLLYFLVFAIWGNISNAAGQYLEIARFGHYFQVYTCYVLYLVPCSLLVRDRSTFEQYDYGVFFLAPLELLGYGLHTSIAYDHNLFDMVLGERNFSLAMCVFFGIIPPIGNTIVRKLDEMLGRTEA